MVSPSPQLSPVTLPVVPGQILGGSYRLVAPIAYGGMGTVWAARAVDQPAAGLVAIKIAHPQFAQERKFRDMFVDEGKLAAAIRHPHVCAVFQVGEDRGALYLVMEWVGGGSLHDMLSVGALSAPLAVRIVADTCAGLHAAHELRDDEGVLRELVHRDVSPQNILISSEGDVKLTDFGVARARDQSHQTTTTGELKGKLSYMAPEALGSREYDRRVDIFSLGCVLYRALVGKRAFDGTSAEVIQALAELRFPRPRDLAPDLDPELEAVILRAMAPAEERYATAEEMQRDLERWLGAPGRAVTRADVAAAVRSTLGAGLSARLAAMEEQADARPSPLPLLRPDEETRRFSPSSSGVLTSVLAGRDTVPDTVETRRATRGRWPLLAGGAALVVAIGGGALVWSRAAAGPSTPADRGAVAVTAPEPPRAPAPVLEVVLSIRANAPGAEVSIDDGPPRPLPLELSVPRDDKEHGIRVSAPGHEPVVQRASFSESRSFVLALVPTPPVERPRASGPTRAPSVPASATPPVATSPATARKPPPRGDIDRDDPFKD